LRKSQEKGSRTGGSPSGSQLLDVFVYLLLQLAKLLQRAFGERSKITWALSQNFITVGFADTLHPSHLLDGLVELFGVSIISFILKMPLLTPGRCLNCCKKATACSRFALPFFTTTISNRSRIAPAVGLASCNARAEGLAKKSWDGDTTSTMSMSLGSGVALTKLPSTSAASRKPQAFASPMNSAKLVHNCGRRSVL